MNDNKQLPSGWGEDDDEDLGFDIQDDETDDTPWGNFAKSKQDENKNEVSDTTEIENQKHSSDNLSSISAVTDTITESLKPQSFRNQASTSVHISPTQIMIRIVIIQIFTPILQYASLKQSEYM